MSISNDATLLRRAMRDALEAVGPSLLSNPRTLYAALADAIPEHTPAITSLQEPLNRRGASLLAPLAGLTASSTTHDVAAAEATIAKQLAVNSLLDGSTARLYAGALVGGVADWLGIPSNTAVQPVLANEPARSARRSPLLIALAAIAIVAAIAVGAGIYFQSTSPKPQPKETAADETTTVQEKTEEEPDQQTVSEQPITYTVNTVSFETYGGKRVESQKVPDGEYAFTPEEPTRSGYTFEGWYTSPSYTEKVVFPFKPTEDIILYAKWEKEAPATQTTSQPESTTPSQSDSQTKQEEQPTTSFETPSTQDTRSDGLSTRSQAFWGVWTLGTKDLPEAVDYARRVSLEGFSAEVFLTTDWSNLNPEPWYVVSLGCTSTEDEAHAVQQRAANAGYDDAYVKYSGSYQP